MFTSVRRFFKPMAHSFMGIAMVLVLMASVAQAAMSPAQFKTKPFNILGQHGAVYKPHRNGMAGQQFLTIKKMASFLATNMFGNLNNQVVVQQLAQQALNSSKKGKNIRLQLKGIATVGQGAYPVPKGLSPKQNAKYQHVRATFNAFDKTTGQPIKGKEATRVLEVMAVRLTPDAGTEDIMTVFNMKGPIQKASANQFLAMMAARHL